MSFPAIIARRDLGSRAWGVLAALRPRQWTKNFLVFAGLIFSRNLENPELLWKTLLAFALFCTASSAVYLFNDLADIDRDRQHPEKRRRPLAAGVLGVSEGWALGVGLLAVSLPAAFALRPLFGGILSAYVVLNIAYSLRLKHEVILDVFTIAAGFELRAVGGAVAIAVPISPWLHVCTILLALFLGLSKRRQEISLLEEGARGHRRSLDSYSLQLLDQMISVVTASTVMAYSLYTFFAENLPKNHSMMITLPFVLYGIFRYLYLVHQRKLGGNPEQVLLKDRPMQIDILLWVASVFLVMYLFD